jgi:hypothetical protein
MTLLPYRYLALVIGLGTSDIVALSTELCISS